MLQKTEITVAGRRVSLLRAGNAGGEPIVLLHGGRAGLSPIVCGAHLFDRVIPLLASGRTVIAPDLPGCGGTELKSPQDLNVEKLAEFVVALLDALSIKRAHVVGHDLGGFIGLWLAVAAPKRLCSLSIVASPMSPPAGDGLNNILFDATPLPLWSRRSQAWAFERLSYGHEHVDAALLDACEQAAAGKPHRDAAQAMQDEQLRRQNFGIGAVKGRVWEALRKDLAVPTQIVWASHDPATSREAGYVLFKVIAERQRAAQFHLINRAGSFLFREQPMEFVQTVGGFQDGVDLELAA
jgi:2-hydroxy-6-oxonona-2,4-dienedioate hydrolase